MVIAKYLVAGLVECCLHAEVIIVSIPGTALVFDGSFCMKEKVQKNNFLKSSMTSGSLTF